MQSFWSQRYFQKKCITAMQHQDMLRSVMNLYSKHSTLQNRSLFLLMRLVAAIHGNKHKCDRSFNRHITPIYQNHSVPNPTDAYHLSLPQIQVFILVSISRGAGSLSWSEIYVQSVTSYLHT